ncbi:class IV lanthionine synthetase LanL [Kitasatospora sp. CM 4170]|uniref:non-specific serine/threonine protein kinase n=1 Tax=Kitasatospora aburaviensis TaxID=67265 RepID=A0ABW1F309_9ACTN|nr:class IV lanthionine synthetase LanL [Kitasatospora sp. CM 4170]WNM45480.1 class IV lanthionine synthetase LanL [Kitasatospora sp. CM 4170]
MARSALAGAGSRGGGGDWDVTVDGFWCTARPTAGELAGEGWKIHVSAASAVGGAVLAAVVETLADDPCAFKFAAGQEQLHELNSRNSERGSAGKFITVYPAGEEQFRRLAAALHLATDGLPGPVILSDRPYRPGSLVHYRYGAFAARVELGNDGGYRSMLHGPGGERVEDVRGASYRCPPWARDPLREPAGSAGVPGHGPEAETGGGGGGGGAGAGGGAGHRRGATRPTAARRGAGGVLLAGRYVVTGAIRHSAKGGVFLGRDTDGGAEVVVKQARAHIEVDRVGTDARAALRHEAALLARLEGLGLAPHPVELVEQDDSLFLVQERIAGQPLGSWVAARLRRDGSPDVDWAEAGPMARLLLDLLERVHELGLVLRDLSPGNVLVQPDGSLRLVDLELAAEAGRRAGSAGTPGYRAPEQGPGRLALVGPALVGTAAGAGSRGRVTDGLCPAEPAADLYALGGLFFLLATGHDPLLPEDLPHARPVADRLGRWLALAARSGDTARRLAPMVLGLRAEEPELRWSLSRVRDALAEAARGDVPEAGAGTGGAEAVTETPGAVDETPDAVDDGRATAGEGRGAVGAEAAGRTWADAVSAGPATAGGTAVLDRVLHDGLRHLAVTATPRRRDRLWPTVPAGQQSDPCNVQHGAAGVLAVLARAASTDGLPIEVREEARRTARTAADWIERRCAAEPVVLPGLHFGRSGAAWALLDAAGALGDHALAERAAELARRIAVEWPNPDVCHGAAGAGFLQLRFAAENLGEESAQDFLDRAVRCGHGLLAAGRTTAHGTVWPVPEDFDSALAGVTHLGFAHGVAGVGAFLLTAAESTGDRALLAGAAEAGRTLAATVRWEHGAASGGEAPHARGAGDPYGGGGVQGEVGGGSAGAWWPQGADDPEHIRPAHWCSGASGVGTFLLRLWQVTGDATAHRLAVAAGRAVLAGRWHCGTGACHGLAGNGEYLLDLAEATGDAEFRRSAEELAHLIAARSALRDGLLVLPDETGTGCAAAYGTGTAGALAFLLRLRHGGPRLWVDPVPAHPAHRPAAGGTAPADDAPYDAAEVPRGADDGPRGAAGAPRRPGEPRPRTGGVRTT